MHFSPKNVNIGVQMLLSVIERIQAKSGCQTCGVERDAAEEGWIHYKEEWDSATTFRAHVRSEEFLRVLVAMDLCIEEPRVIIGSLNAVKGIEFLRTLRGRAAD
jgi:quinol monooxygenase YgiN